MRSTNTTQGLQEMCSGGLLVSVALSAASTGYGRDEMSIPPRVLEAVLILAAWYAWHETTVMRSIDC